MIQLAKALEPIAMSGVQTRLTPEEEQLLLRVLRDHETLSVGAGGAPENNAFEREFTAYIGCADSVALSNCSSALGLAATLAKPWPRR